MESEIIDCVEALTLAKNKLVTMLDTVDEMDMAIRARKEDIATLNSEKRSLQAAYDELADAARALEAQHEEHERGYRDRLAGLEGSIIKAEQRLEELRRVSVNLAEIMAVR